VQAESFDPTPANLDARTQRFVLDSGLKVALLPKGTRGQAVQARLRLRFGDVATLNGQDAVAGFVGALLDKGGAGLTRQQIADQFDRLQADVGFFAHGQTVAVDITTKRERCRRDRAGRQAAARAELRGPALEEVRSSG
jgi:zinc protease